VTYGKQRQRKPVDAAVDEVWDTPRVAVDSRVHAGDGRAATGRSPAQNLCAQAVDEESLDVLQEQLVRRATQHESEQASFGPQAPGQGGQLRPPILETAADAAITHALLSAPHDGDQRPRRNEDHERSRLAL
jgi:hypothetical protein